MHFLRPALVAMVFCFSIPNFAQDMERTKKDSLVQSYWMVGLGTNFVDDSGDEFRILFDIDRAWHMPAYPSRFSIGHYLKNGFGFEAIGALNKYREGKIVDDVALTEDIPYYSLDFRVSYDLNHMLGHTGFFDPYIGVGAGYTDANHQGRGTFNATFGFRTWFSDRWGLDVNTSGKWAMNTDNGSNHIQHAVGVAYRFGIEKGLTRKGMEKLAQWEELEKEQQRVQDSIAKAEKDARLLAERLQREKEAADLAAAEKAKKDAEDARRTALQNKIDALGTVYFKFNSSYLTPQDRELLNKLADIMQGEPSMKIRVSAHTDSRGTHTYNQWLSERRAKRTVDYVISKGISENRISHEAFGETRLVNQCGDGVGCTEADHAKNRRSEFIIVEF